MGLPPHREVKTDVRKGWQTDCSGENRYRLRARYGIHAVETARINDGGKFQLPERNMTFQDILEAALRDRTDVGSTSNKNKIPIHVSRILQNTVPWNLLHWAVVGHRVS
jgi:hypothetical protein